MNDEVFFELATKEFSAGKINQSLFSKAQALAVGDEKASKYKYIELRAKQLRDEKYNRILNAGKTSGGIIISAFGSFFWSLVKTTFIAGILIFVVFQAFSF